jgi:hypothetical protein
VWIEGHAGPQIIEARTVGHSRCFSRDIARAIKPSSTAAKSRSALLGLIETHAFDATRGFYVPVADFVELDGKLPAYSEKLCPTRFPNSVFPYCYFTNALLIPVGYGDDGFDEKSALKPKYRATNIGFVTITIEYDCQTTDQMEECLAWTRGEFSRSPFAAVDRDLTRFADYRGFTMVFSGNKSIHFHVLFSTKHLESAPWDLTAVDRLAQSHADLLNQAHQIYWDTTAEIFDSALHPSLSPDKKLRSLVQWRRSPWALRRLEQDSDVLGLPIGTIIPQLVIREHIRTRAPRHSQDFLVPAEFRPTKTSRPKSSLKRAPAIEIDDEVLLSRLEECCQEEWGDYPKPAAARFDGRDWIINFRNAPDDENPSTFVKGPYRRLLVGGRHADSFTQTFFLPDHMCADELCASLTEADRQTEDAPGLPSPEIPPFLTSEHQPKPNWIESQIDRIHSSFAEPIAETESDEIKTVYRQRLSSALWEARIFDAHMVIRGPEGIGKTTGLLDELALEILDLAMSIYPKQQFACIACRSIPQAEAKAQEYRQSGKYRNAVVLMSVQKRYERQCEAQGVKPIPSHNFPDHSLNGFLGHIKIKQPEVFEALILKRTPWKLREALFGRPNFGCKLV